MSINWVMLSPTTNPPYTPLSNEQHLLAAPGRIGLSLQSPSHYPGKQQQPFSLKHAVGALYLTNQRIIYLPDKPTGQLQSFTAPILNLHDSHVTLPMFGANTWTASMQPVQGGGIPTPPTGVVELKFTFKDAGAHDFHTAYLRIRERLQQAVEVSRIHADGSGAGQGALNGIDVSNVNLEELPAYSEQSQGPLLAPTAAAAQASRQRNPAVQQSRDSGVDVQGDRPQPKPTNDTFSPPDEPPPGYEETQMSGLQDDVGRRPPGAR